MSQKATKWTIWLLLYATVPVPYILGAVEVAPPLRLTFFSLIIAGARILEGSGGWVWTTLVALTLVQSAFYASALLAPAILVSRLLSTISDRGRRLTVIATVASVLVLASLFPIYETPVSSVAQRSNLRQIFQ